jgi:two-component system CheB/CheR fusion protein
MNAFSPLRRVNGRAPAAEAVSVESLRRICDLLADHMGNDFSCYRRPTILRRIENRMHTLRCDNADEYARYVCEHSEEQDLLAKDLLIKVTSFVRNPKSFEVLGETVSGELLADKSAQDPLRVWVPGCSSGEEAYSLAIPLNELLGQQHKVIDVQIFGTDLDPDAIDAARKGVYSARIEKDVTSDRLKRFFTRQPAGLYQTAKPIRKMVIFAPQDVLRDPPFHKLDVISCRNLLIYLENEAQERLLRTFHHSLKTDGILFLGSGESVEPARDLFTPLNAKWKIFRRQEAPSTRELPYQLMLLSPKPVHRIAESRRGGSQITRLIEQALVQNYAPTSVVVNTSGDIAYINGHTGAYLNLIDGQTKLNVLEMIDTGLRSKLADALFEAAAIRAENVLPARRVTINGTAKCVEVRVSPLPGSAALLGMTVVEFRLAPEQTRRKRVKSKLRPTSRSLAQL